jgi:hypothetical protein
MLTAVIVAEPSGDRRSPSIAASSRRSAAGSARAEATCVIHRSVRARPASAGTNTAAAAAIRRLRPR